MHLFNSAPLSLVSMLLVQGAWATDYMVAYSQCRQSGTCQMRGVRHKDQSSHIINNLLSGCHSNTGVPNICIDWPRRRGHFYFNGGGKRCITHQGESGAPCEQNHICRMHNWVESLCAWSIAEEGGAQIAVESNTTLVTNPNDPRLSGSGLEQPLGASPTATATA
ncbi:hypothetical protein B0T16DRAFT_392976 [Cercophora newfieldiana]|uniref:Uncharacterized protein n=1 Tax=Cercophora newfieldiana TaxID=92897 RepID=A0AA39Y285_9PEZI|nr:hypothetical protein B0T16DRAFT_392976 [Cercophora newfieldiana]